MQRVRDRIKAITAPRHRLPEPVRPLVDGAESRCCAAGAPTSEWATPAAQFAQIDQLRPRAAGPVPAARRRGGRGGGWKVHTPDFFRALGVLPTQWNRGLGDGNADSGAVNDLGKPCAGEPHARFDEGRLETGSGLGSAEPATHCMDSAGPFDHRASLLLYHWFRLIWWSCWLATRFAPRTYPTSIRCSQTREIAPGEPLVDGADLLSGSARARRSVHGKRLSAAGPAFGGGLARCRLRARRRSATSPRRSAQRENHRGPRNRSPDRDSSPNADFQSIRARTASTAWRSESPLANGMTVTSASLRALPAGPASHGEQRTEARVVVEGAECLTHDALLTSHE